VPRSAEPLPRARRRSRRAQRPRSIHYSHTPPFFVLIGHAASFTPY
jgi:hypothetical protein